MGHRTLLGTGRKPALYRWLMTPVTGSGDYAGSIAYAYWRGVYNQGTISAEPIPGAHIGDFNFFNSLLPFGYASIWFTHDDNNTSAMLALLAGKKVHVNGVPYPFTTDWNAAGGAGEIQGEWSVDGAVGVPQLQNGVTYLIEIR